MSRVAATASPRGLSFRAGDLNEDERTIMQGAMDMKVKTAREVMTRVELKILRRVRLVAPASTPSKRRMLDSVLVLVPHRSTEPARQPHRREMTW